MRTLTALAATLIAAAPLATRADTPSYATPPTATDPATARSADGSSASTAVTTYASPTKKATRIAFVYTQGTIINPTGLTLAPGMVVSVLGFNNGPSFSANEIDTPYTSYDGGWYYHDRPYAYYGPSYGLSFFFGSVGWWHGGYFGGPYRFNNGFRIYANVGFPAYGRAGYGYGHGYGHAYGYGRAYGPGYGYGYGHPGYYGRGYGYAHVRGSAGYTHGFAASRGGYAHGYAGRGGFAGHAARGH